MMFLKDRDWSYPLEDLDRKLDEHFDVITAEKIYMARHDFLREWSFLMILWRRLQNDLKIFYESRSQIKEVTKENFKRNVRIGRLMSYSLDCIHLDTNCFLLNARILMDRVAYLTTFFWEKIAKEEPKSRSFNAHKKSIRNLYKTGKIIDDDYARYVIQHTVWFEKKLKDIRDDLIVHRGKHSYVDAFKGDSGKVMKGKAIFKDGEVEFYMKQIPDLNELMDDICDFLKFFDRHFSQML